MHFVTRMIQLIGVGLAAMFMTGCVAQIGPGGAAPGLLHSDVTYPNALNPNMSYRIGFEREDIELLGPVDAEASSKWVFFLFSWGDSGYAKLVNQARDIGADGVMNVTIDTSYESYFLFYAKVTMNLSGVAYRYRRLPGEPGGPPLAESPEGLEP